MQSPSFVCLAFPKSTCWAFLSAAASSNRSPPNTNGWSASSSSSAPRRKAERNTCLAVLQQAFSQTDAPDPRLPLFFTKSSASQSSGLAFLKRTKARKDDRDVDNGSAVTDPQAKALITWCSTPDPEHAILRAIRQPTLVVSGSHDTMLPANNAYAMFRELSKAQLVLYPDSGHGALFQHHETFVSHVRTSLDAQPAAA